VYEIILGDDPFENEIKFIPPEDHDSPPDLGLFPEPNKLY